MSQIHETGYAKNVANFKKAVVVCEGYGTRYNPSREVIKVANLNNQYTNALGLLSTVKDSKTAFDNITNARAIEFEDIPKFSTRLVNNFASHEVPAQALADARGHHKKVQGKRAQIKKDLQPKDENTAPLDEQVEDKKISVSQLSYDSITDNFEELVSTVIAQPNFKPNEEDFKPAQLQARVARLRQHNLLVAQGHNSWANARINRDRFMYDPLSGMKDILTAVKNYALSLFGSTSPEYRLISGIEFTALKKR